MSDLDGQEEREMLSAFVRRGAVAGRMTELADSIEVLERELSAALAAREPITVWTCMSCGSHGEGQSCGNCGHEAMPGRWLSAEGVERQLKDAWQQRDEAVAAREDTERRILNLVEVGYEAATENTRLREEAEGTHELLAHFRDERAHLTTALRAIVALRRHSASWWDIANDALRDREPEEPL